MSQTLEYVSRASAVSALARAEQDTDLGLARDRLAKMRKSGKPDLRGPRGNKQEPSTRWCLEVLARGPWIPDLRSPAKAGGARPGHRRQ